MSDQEKRLDDLEQEQQGEECVSGAASQAADAGGELAEGAEDQAYEQAPAAAEASAPPSQSQGETAAEPPEDLVEKARAEASKMRDQMLRVAADFDNYRKRTRREIDDAGRRAREDFLREVLPVFDNLERAVAHADQAADVRSMADGMKMVLKQFLDTLAKLGVKRVETVGVAFDPAVHEAIQQIATSEQPAGTVVAEVQPGYCWEERLVRAAMVVVAKAPPAEQQEQAGGSGL
jgi:molecular chaperone GrpE